MSNDNGLTKPGALRQEPQCRIIERTGPIAMSVSGRLAERVLALAIASGASSVESYCEQVLEFFVVEHRSNRVRPDPARHEARHAEDWQLVG